ncbi:MAG: beta-lactamase family protein [Opitutaceae bacterium]|nr:beta-lactamase family protein [Opitutaceae bacterium]
MKARQLRRLGGFPPCAPAAGAATRAAADAALRAATERRVIPGVVALAVDRGGVIYAGAAGVADSHSRRAMQADVIFRIASMTKAVTGVALMQLVEAGKVSLDDLAAKHLPEFGRVQKLVGWDPVAKTFRLEPPRTPITLRHLATHTAGFGYGFTSAALRDFKPRDGDAPGLPPLLFEPGTDWLYGTNIDHLGRIVERLSGLTLEDYFQQRIFRPLGMVDTSYILPEPKRHRLAALHRRGWDGTIVQPPQDPSQPATRFNGGGGLYSTAADYGRFLRMLLNGGALDGARILSPATVAEMGRNHIGALGVRALKSAQHDRSGDFTFVADGRDKWGVSFQITADAVPGKRASGSLSWGGINNTYFWLDPRRGVAGVILMQFLPFADPQALALYDAFERAVYAGT